MLDGFGMYDLWLVLGVGGVNSSFLRCFGGEVDVLEALKILGGKIAGQSNFDDVILKINENI